MSAKRKSDLIPTVLVCLPSLKLLRMGWDTEQIARAKGLTEATVYNQLDAIRENERRLADMEFDRTFQSIEQVAPLLID